MAGNYSSLDIVTLLNILAMGDAKQVGTLVTGWNTLGGVVDARTGRSGSSGADSVMGVTNSLSSWTGGAADEYRRQSTSISTYGRALSTSIGNSAMASGGQANTMAGTMTSVQGALGKAQQTAQNLDEKVASMTFMENFLLPYIQALAVPRPGTASPTVTTFPVIGTGSMVRVVAPQSIVVAPPPGPNTPAPVAAPATVTVILPSNVAAASTLGSLTAAVSDVTAQWLFDRLNEPLRQQAAVAVNNLADAYQKAVLQLPTVPRSDGIPQKYSASATANTMPAPPSVPSGTVPAASTAGLTSTGGSPGANGVSPGASAASGGLTSGANAGTAPGANTSLAGFNPTSTSPVSAAGLTTPTSTSGLSTIDPGTGGPGTTGLASAGPGGTSSGLYPAAAIAPGYYGAGLAGGALGGSSAVTGGTGTGLTPGTGPNDGNVASESLLTGEPATAAGAAGRTGAYPPMYPPMMPPTGQGDRERTRGTYLPDDDVWIDGLDTAPALIIGV